MKILIQVKEKPDEKINQNKEREYICGFDNLEDAYKYIQFMKSTMISYEIFEIQEPTCDPVLLKEDTRVKIYDIKHIVHGNI